MILTAVLILLLILLSCVSILSMYRKDMKNRKYFFCSLVITMIGTFSGVLMAVALSDHQSETKEKNELKAIIRQAYFEVSTVSYRISYDLAYISSVLEESSVGHVPRSETEIVIYKQKLKNGGYDRARTAILDISSSESVDRLTYCESLYNSPLSSKYISSVCRALMYLLRKQEKSRRSIRAQDSSVEDRFGALADYWKITDNLEKLVRLSDKALKGKITKEEESEIEKIGGFSRVITGGDGNEYFITPFPD